MKNKALLLCALFTIPLHCSEQQLSTITLHCSKQQKQIDLIKQIDYKKIEQTLRDNYITYACGELEKYKNGNYTLKNIQIMVSMSEYMTGSRNFFYNQIRDTHGDSFIRIAVKKMDLPVVDWHVTKQGAHSITEEDFNYCITSCIKELHPTKTPTISNETVAYNILKILTMKDGYYATICLLNLKQQQELLIKQLILLQIKHKKYGSNFPEELIKLHTTLGNKDKFPLILEDVYQNIANKKGNTLSHIVVCLQDANELYELINKNYISFAPNNAGKTIVDLALDHFQMLTQDESNFDKHSEKGKNARCCLFMLLRYIKKIQSEKLNNEYKCCDKHVITL